MNVRWEDFGKKNDRNLSETAIFQAIAKKTIVNINSYREADTFNCELDYRNFPFDPRCLRAVGITIHIEDRKHLFINETGQLDFVKPVKNVYDADGNVKSGNTIFIGFADDENIDLDETNRVIRLEGRDYTALLIDTPHPGTTIDYQRPLDVVLQGLLSELKTTNKIIIVNRTGETFPTLSEFGFEKTELANQKSGKKDSSYWDVIQDLVSQAGLIAFIELDKLIISKPRNLYSGDKAYQFIYGRNLKTLSFKRKLGRQKGINILLRSVNLSSKLAPLVTAKIPEEATLEWCKEIGVERKAQTVERIGSDGKPIDPPETAPYITFNVSDISDKDVLVQKAQSLWEEIGRQQIEGTLTTKEMKQIQDNNIEFDITKIRNGTPINVEIGQGDVKGLNNVGANIKKDPNDQDEKLYRQKVDSARENFLISKGYDPDIARAFSKTLGLLNPLFYTKSVEFTIDQENGFEMSLDFINFINIKR